MNTYPSYKDSGVEWIGEIPSGWRKSKLKYELKKILTGGTPNTSNEHYWTDVDGINWISISDMTSNPKGVTSSKKQITLEGLNSKNLKILPSDSLIYSIYGSIGKVNRIKIESSIHQGILGLITDKELKTKFLEYYLNFLYKDIRSFSSGTTQDNLNQEKVNNFEITIPPLQEQQQISDYLDYKTSKIDKLIEKTQQKIELLKEQRTSLINTTVTKGLNPDVEMKNSGVEWIGDIPSGWDVKPLKYVSNYNTNSLGNNTDPEYELNYLEISDVDSLGNIKKPTQYTFSKSPSRCRRIVQKDDIIISTVRTYLKSIGFIKNEVRDLICSTGFCVITPNKTRIIPSILFYMVRMNSFISTVISLSEGVSYPSINSDKLVGVKILIPPIKEQQQIVDYLDREISKIDKLIDNESRRIDLLKEYRQSLISDVVTGKVDVRDEVIV